MSVRRLENLRDINGGPKVLGRHLPKVEKVPEAGEMAELDLYLLKEYKKMHSSGKPRQLGDISPALEGSGVHTPMSLRNVKEIAPYKSPLPMMAGEQLLRQDPVVETGNLAERESNLREVIVERSRLGLKEIRLKKNHEMRGILSARWAQLVIDEAERRRGVIEGWKGGVDKLKGAKENLDVEVFMGGAGVGENVDALQRTVVVLRSKVQELTTQSTSEDATEWRNLENDLRMAHATILELRSELRCKDLEIRNLKRSLDLPTTPPAPATIPRESDAVSSCDSQDLNEEAPSVFHTPRCVPPVLLGNTSRTYTFDDKDKVLGEQIIQETAVRHKKWLTKAASYDALLQYMVPGLEIPPLAVNSKSPFIDQSLEEQIHQEHRSRSNRTLAKSESLYLLRDSDSNSPSCSPRSSHGSVSSIPQTPRGMRQQQGKIIKATT